MDPMYQRIHALWDLLAERGSGGDEALLAALAGLCEVVEAQQAFWIGAVRMGGGSQGDPMKGWRPRAVRYLHPLPAREALYREQCRQLDRGDVDPSIVANLRNAGQFRVNIAHELVPDWFDTDYYRAYSAPFGIQDSLYMAMPLGEDVESWFGFHRVKHPAFCFGEAERALLTHASRSMKWFHRQLALSHGLLLAENPLMPSERRVLTGLLTERTEREIADELSLSPATIHTYATRIYRKFGVRGRVGLAALWIGQELP